MKKIKFANKKFWVNICAFFADRISPVFMIFVNDLRRIFKSTSVLIIIIGLCLLPSLYAWINIYACWDPYSKTGNLPIAIVNKDQGTVFSGKEINVGDGIVEQLKNNKSIGWDFVDEWQGNYGLNNGKYYAIIVIPDNFSTRLVTLTTDKPQKPTITYSVNEKLNSIATKIADASKNQLVSTIQSNFVKAVTEEVINTLKIEMKSSGFKASQIKDLKNTFEDANSDVTELKEYISQANTDSENFQNYLTKSVSSLSKVNNKISSMQKIVDSNKSLTLVTKQLIQGIISNLNTDVQQLSALDKQNQELISVLNQLNSNGVDKDVIGTMEQCSNLCNSEDIILKSDSAQVRALNKSYNLSSLDLLADTLDYMDHLILDEKSALDTQIPILRSDKSKESVSSALSSLSGLSSKITSQVQNVSNSVQVDCIPLLNNITNDLLIEFDDANNMSELCRSFVSQLGALGVFAGASSKLTVSQANQLNDMLTVIQDDLNQLISTLNIVTNQNIDELIELAQNNPSELSNFISSPVEIKQIQCNDSSTFGVGLTPFYTVLAIWIGALLSCALLTVECEDTINGVTPSLKQQHFGKMLLFLLLSLIQSSIITLGDVFLLGVKPANLGLMLGVTVLTSITFTVIIFTLVSLFGNVGKGIVVIMMVFQIAGAGGIYPIQTNPRIFGILEPLWPFTYAINYFREAIAGPVRSIVMHNVWAMLFFLITFLLLAELKKPFHRINTVIDRKYKESQI